MLSYPIDLSQPYDILSCNADETYMVAGTAKTMVSKFWLPERPVKFGGHKSIFIVRKEQFLTHDMKKKLRWVRKHLGVRQYDKLLQDLYDSAIAGHTIKDT